MFICVSVLKNYSKGDKMKKTKNIVIATVLLAVGTISNQEEDTKDIIIEAVEEQTTTEPSMPHLNKKL